MIFSSLKEYEGMKPGLSRIRRFLKESGNPQTYFKCVHIAGTNGKGSVAVLTANMLSESGYRTALYTSPHLVDITERIKVDGKDIPKKTFKSISGKYLPLAKKCKLSYFEYLTALAFLYFKQKKVEIAVLETGLGGRFDATNIIKNPLVCMITSIALDHQEILGGTIEEIAFEKAGIIKKGADVICGELPKDALRVIKAKSEPFVFGKDFKALNIRINRKTRISLFDYRGIKRNIDDIKLSLSGEHQIRNASAAACCAEVLGKKGFFVSDEALKKSFADTKWPARFDIRKLFFNGSACTLIIDGAHNEQGIKAFLAALKLYYGEKKLTFIFAMMKEKEYAKAVKMIAPYADKVILVRLKNSRALPVEELAKEFYKYKPREKVFKAGSVLEAFKFLKNRDTAVVAGSLYLAGEALKNINNKDK